MPHIDQRNFSTGPVAWAIIPGLLFVGQAAFGQFPTPPSWTNVPQTQFFYYAPGNGQVNLNGAQPTYNYNFVGSNPPAVADQLGCVWNTSDMTPPPYWYQYVGWDPLIDEYRYEAYSGAVMRGGPDPPGGPGAVGSWYQPSQTFGGFKAIASFVPGDFIDGSTALSPYQPSLNPSSSFGESATIYYSENKCFGGDMEYGFAYSPDASLLVAGGLPAGGMAPKPNATCCTPVTPGPSPTYEVINFYFTQYANCPPMDANAGSTWCMMGAYQPYPPYATFPNWDDFVTQCGGNVGFALPPNSKGNYWYNFTAWSYDAAGVYQIAAQVTDAYTGAIAWEITANPANLTATWSSPSPAATLYYENNNNCPSSTTFNTQQLANGSGGVVVGISGSNGATDPYNTTTGTVALSSTYVYTGN